MRLGIVLGVCFLVLTCSVQAVTVTELFERIGSFPEEVLPDERENWLDPSFNSFYDRVFAYRLPLLGSISLGELFSFQEVCEALASYLPLDHLKHEGRYSFAQCSLSKDDRVIVVGDLHGAIHSLARLFFRWMSQGKIDEEFTIVDPHLYVTFLGDYLNRSPYGFWLLPLLVWFSNKNPGRVFLLRGNQESDGYWEQFRAAREYCSRVAPYSKEDILIYAPEINNFFQQLPDGVLFSLEGCTERFLVSHSKKPEGFVPDPLSIAHVSGERRVMREVDGRGLLFDQFDRGTAVWNVFSAPVFVYSTRGILDRDAYAEVLIGESIAKSRICRREYERISLDSEKVKSRLSSEQVILNEYSLAYGHELVGDKAYDQLVQSKPLFICSSVDLTGGLRGMGIGIKEGVEARFLEANASGELFNYLVRPVFLDDSYEPLKMEKNVQILIKVFGVDSLLLAMGSPTVTQILPLVESGKLILFFPATGSPLFRRSEMVNMVHMRHSYAEEVYPLLERLRLTYGVRKFSFVYQDDAFGKPLTDAAVEYLHDKYPDSQIQKISILRGHTPQKAEIEELRRFNPDAIGLFITTQLQLGGLADRLGIGFLLGKHLFAIDFSTDIFHEFVQRWGVLLLQSSSFQQPFGLMGNLMDKYRFAMKQYRYPLTITSVEGYTAASWYIAAFQKSYPDISAFSIKDRLEQLDSHDVFGYSVPFDFKTRSFVGPVWVNDRGRLYQAQKGEEGYQFVLDTAAGSL